jgi:GTP pyrophosphokinase
MPADLAWIAQLQEVASQLSEGKEVDIEHLKVDLFGNRIFIYSPKGDIYDMPEGAYPLDYAYRIHSDIGMHAAGFMVNGKMKPFNYVLQHGDVVEVITKANAKPKKEWLDHTITKHARDKLRSQLKKTRM